MNANNGYNITPPKPLKPYRQSQLHKRKSNQKPRYNGNQRLQLHTLLESLNVPKAYLTTMLNLSSPKTCIKLINTPTNINIQQLINMAFLLNVDIYDLLRVIIEDLHYSNCVSSTNEHIKPFVNEDVKILHNSSEWFNR